MDKHDRWVFVLLVLMLNGCGGTQSSDEPIPVTPNDLLAESQNSNTSATAEIETEAFDRATLLTSRLPLDEASKGWINLFDGSTLFGWESDGKANFRVEDNLLVVDQGEKSLLCTNLQWDQYELMIEYRAEQSANSGVFLSTDLAPGDITTDCYEVNIAPNSHPFPTGSVVERKVSSNVPESDSETWRVMRIRYDGNALTVTLDSQVVCEYVDPQPQGIGRIGLQHNEGRIEFRKVRLRPLGLTSLLDAELSGWKQYPEMDADFSVTAEGAMRVQGGSGQIETVGQFDDFILLSEYKLPTPETNSGIFFRCIPGDKMMGYECQVSNFGSEEDPLVPADCGAGGIFRRQEARLIAGENDQWVTILLHAQGPTMAAWVNGVPVSNWTDTRDLNENPRRGKRLEAGTIMIQGHDPETDALFRQLKIRPTK